MPKIRSSMFTKYEFTEQEREQVVQLPEMLEMYLETLRAEIAERKVALAYDPQNPLRFTQAEAEYQGQILLLGSLLDESKDTKARKLDEAMNSFEE